MSKHGGMRAAVQCLQAGEQAMDGFKQWIHAEIDKHNECVVTNTVRDKFFSNGQFFALGQCLARYEALREEDAKMRVRQMMKPPPRDIFIQSLLEDLDRWIVEAKADIDENHNGGWRESAAKKEAYEHVKKCILSSMGVVSSVT